MDSTDIDFVELISNSTCKTNCPSMWTLIELGHASDAYMSHETLGVIMQLVVLFISLLVLEVASSKAKNS